MSSETQPDPVAAYLADVAKRYRAFGESDAMLRLLAAVEAALDVHTPLRGAGRMICAECVDRWSDGEHKEWPCDTVQAISRELLGEEKR